MNFVGVSLGRRRYTWGREGRGRGAGREASRLQPRLVSSSRRLGERRWGGGREGRESALPSSSSFAKADCRKADEERAEGGEPAAACACGGGEGEGSGRARGRRRAVEACRCARLERGRDELDACVLAERAGRVAGGDPWEMGHHPRDPVERDAWRGRGEGWGRGAGRAGGPEARGRGAEGRRGGGADGREGRGRGREGRRREGREAPSVCRRKRTASWPVLPTGGSARGGDDRSGRGRACPPASPPPSTQ